ncbi:NAD(P)-dependent alcohol dehydrogenase [Naasia lichenicola]|uniref:NAD(P)-dependent alcohol dehydrogenase n=1 Tax=Naasia lichenicola TaxID=2565933 RepID=A0A4S4FNQ5_9MICO|nr:NAD(P)-dependent alcohol dehydrogenase [Naasia lichenicola]THG31512.1 NAD(P)-dependent alcohol dehydrogenase [Naasia lichenicola]
MTIAAITWSEDEDFVLEEVQLDEPRADELRVRMIAVGVCHTDLSVAHGVTPFPLPGVLGHEGAGIVEAIGPNVRRASVGDRVLLSFTSCGTCRNCEGGHPGLCVQHLSLNLLGGTRADGSATMSASGRPVNAHFFGQSSFAHTAIVDERSVVRLDPETTDEDMIVLAPLGCGLQTGAGAVLNVLRPRAGSTLLVLGAGAVGMAAVMAGAMTAASRIIVVDRVAARLQLALELGATDVIDATNTALTDALAALIGDVGVDYAVESTGNVGVLEDAITALAVGGVCAVIGAPRAGSRASFDVPRLLPGRSIIGITLGDSEPQSFVPFLIDAWRHGRFPIDRLERRYPFEDINLAAADAASGATIKPVLTF